jgi:putative membrane protein
MMGYDGTSWGGGLWMLVGLLLVIGVIVLIVWLVTRSRAGGTTTQGSARSTPSEILAERFARGEITEAEFEQAKKALGPDR